MAPSLRTVVRRTGLVPLTGSLEPVVRWVAVSELEDPTPYLEGDELLLTTGMRLDGDFSGYVGRLVERGVAGLALGVGLTHEEVPPALLSAATRAGLPLLEVPRETPFIAVGKAVSDLLAAEQYEQISRAFAAQGRLTRAALRPEGTHAVIDRLAKEVRGWAALLDEHGEVRHATRAAKAEAVARELAPGGPLAAGGRLPASLALSGPDEHVVVQPLGGGARPRGFFAVGAAQAFSPVTQTVVNAAGSLLTLSLEQGGAQRESERRVRSAVLRMLLAGADERARGEQGRPGPAGALEQARAVLEPLGARLPDPPVVALVMAEDTLETVEPHAFTARLPGGGAVVALVADERADQVAAIPAGTVGISAPRAYEELGSALDQARRAYESGREGPVRFADLAGQGLLGLLDPAAAQAFAAALLDPLTRYGSRADLVESLRAYLGSNGHWDAAAQRLGVHRHTLRYRMKRVTELLGRDLDDPGTRAELWLALAATDHAPVTSACPPGSSRSSPS
ncbi:PucR family transcriptional regulator [Nonomuraea rhizosphaerae]|uniref:PucR family transcriptional regulator n=1 Tax=Nonomuraea rhizosphaerae TaxID=2665663 RepID=UPI001C5CDA2F|nr:PucR family transcriptional regulator [Nonomuraea rhizosphaerae]